MSTENNGSTGETQGQEQQGQQAGTTGETSGNGDQQQTGSTQDQSQSQSQEPVKLPDDHPLVKTLNTNKDTIKSLRAEVAELRANSAKTTQLEEELGKRPTTEALETLQTRYDRLEAFLVAAGGPLGKALDSRTFTRDLFETDKDIESLVKDWHKANPTTTSQALGSGAASPAGNKPDPNALLRAAIGR